MTSCDTFRVLFVLIRLYRLASNDDHLDTVMADLGVSRVPGGGWSTPAPSSPGCAALMLRCPVGSGDGGEGEGSAGQGGGSGYSGTAAAGQRQHRRRY